MTDYFISCDWGTSSFRIRLIRTSTLEIVHTIENSELGFGKQSLSQADYLQQLEEHLHRLCERGILDDIPVSIISGMASSSIGLKNLPYGKLPLSLQDCYIPYEALPGFSSPVYLFSGLSTHEDVMRGEEVQVVGAAQKIGVPKENHLFILPGTHSKHVFLEQGQLVTFNTYLTGELFSLLQTHSILRHSVKKEQINLQKPMLLEAFRQGLHHSSFSLLHELFTIRARQLLQNTDPVENYAYLSGLLIGNELRSISKHTTENLILCADSPVADLYQQAIYTLYPDKNLHLVSTEEATILGHHILLQQIHAS